MAVPGAPEGRRPKAAFTLLELLVVIFIVVLLAGLLLSGVVLVVRSTERREAATQTRSLVTALKAYRLEYGQWPGQTQAARDRTYTDNAFLVAGLTNNPRGLVLIDISRARLLNGNYVDPWKRPYIVALDENGDGQVEINATMGAEALQATVSGETVAAASWGRAPKDPASRIVSW